MARSAIDISDPLEVPGEELHGGRLATLTLCLIGGRVEEEGLEVWGDADPHGVHPVPRRYEWVEGVGGAGEPLVSQAQGLKLFDENGPADLGG